MLFNSLYLELAFCAAVGGSGASSRRTLQGADNPPPLVQIVKTECGVGGAG